MGLFWPGVPEPLALWMRDRFDARTFVETGTHAGGTASWASRHFDSVVSIEAHEGFYKAAREKHGGIANLRLVHGNSRTALAPVLEELKTPAVLWLDAHWSSGGTFGEGSECPLLDELRYVNASTPDHLVLIDDARLFLAPPPPPSRVEEWPDLKAVLQALSPPERPRYVAVYEDVIVGVPLAVREPVIQYLQNHPGRNERPRPAGPFRRLFGRLRGSAS